MKILAFVDLHGNKGEYNPGSKGAYKKLQEKAKDADIILCAGDMTIFEEDLSGMMKKIAALKKPVYVLHGNHEEALEVKHECDKYENLHFAHQRIFKIDDVVLFGYGGGGFSEKDAQFEVFMKDNKKHLGKKNVLFTHAPPQGTVIDELWEEHVGNMSIAHWLSSFDVVISGHIHENAGKKEKKDSMLIMNPGPEGMLFTP